MSAPEEETCKKPTNAASTAYSRYMCRCIRCKAWKIKATAEQLVRAKKYYRKYARQCREKYKRYRLNNKEKVKLSVRKAALRNQFGITLDEYNNILMAQNGVCAICKKLNNSGINLAVDHCHETKQNRGLLCSKCNIGLGQFNDDKVLLQESIKYLAKYDRDRENSAPLQD